MFFGPSVDDHGSSVIFRSVSVRPKHLFDPTLQTMITTSNSLLRGSGMPIHVDGVLVHAMSGYELSRVRTEFDPLRILPAVPPHPVQPNRESSGHRHLGNTFCRRIARCMYGRLQSASQRAAACAASTKKILSTEELRQVRTERRQLRTSFKGLAAKFGISTWSAFQICKKVRT
jgi:hypothetical protein